MIKAILFDVGGTLIKPHPSVGHIYARVAADFGVKADPEDLNQRFKSVWKSKQAEMKSIDKNWWKDVVLDVFNSFVFNSFYDFFNTLYKEFDDPKCWTIFPDVLPTLTELKNRKIKLAIASNWDSRLPDLLNALNLSSFFDHQFISFQLGRVKPDPFFFSSILNQLKISEKHVLHVGDDPLRDEKAAKKAGIQCFLVNRPQKTLKHLCYKTFTTF